MIALHTMRAQRKYVEREPSANCECPTGGSADEIPKQVWGAVAAEGLGPSDDYGVNLVETYL